MYPRGKGMGFFFVFELFLNPWITMWGVIRIFTERRFVRALLEVGKVGGGHGAAGGKNGVRDFAFPFLR